MLANAQLSSSTLDKFALSSTQANLLKQVRGSLPAIASAFRCYTAFCNLKGFTAFPPTEEAALQWSSVFDDTATFGNYIQHLAK